jgi:hypothetical protein
MGAMIYDATMIEIEEAESLITVGTSSLPLIIAGGSTQHIMNCLSEPDYAPSVH